MSKKTISILILIFILIISVSILFSMYKSGAQESCYIWNTESGDSALLRLKIDNGGKVSGFLDFNLFAKDRKRGAVSGILSGDTAHLRWLAQAEGKSTNEELMINLTDNIAQPGVGEMVEQDGIYNYANRESVLYPINLQKTDCSDQTLI